MAHDEDFLRRWSRRKRETAAAASAPAAPDPAPAPELPPLDSIDFESDFKAFMHAKVDEGVKRAALKKLFSDPRFNVMDGLDVYIEDFSKGETLTPEMVATLEHAKSTLLGRREEEKEDEKTEEPQEASAKKDDGDTRQDA